MTLAPFLASLKVTDSALRNGPIRRVTLAFFAYNAVEFGAWTGVVAPADTTIRVRLRRNLV